MPKNRKRIKIDNRFVISKNPTKHRIGTRKSGSSANLMSSAALLAVLEDKNKTKWHQHARHVLSSRGVKTILIKPSDNTAAA